MDLSFFMTGSRPTCRKPLASRQAKSGRLRNPSSAGLLPGFMDFQSRGSRESSWVLSLSGRYFFGGEKNTSFRAGSGAVVGTIGSIGFVTVLETR